MAQLRLQQYSRIFSTVTESTKDASLFRRRRPGKPNCDLNPGLLQITVVLSYHPVISVQSVYPCETRMCSTPFLSTRRLSDSDTLTEAVPFTFPSHNEWRPENNNPEARCWLWNVFSIFNQHISLSNLPLRLLCTSSRTLAFSTLS